MNDDSSLIRPRQPGSLDDPLTESAREGARRMLATALEAEIGAFPDEALGWAWGQFMLYQGCLTDE